MKTKNSLLSYRGIVTGVSALSIVMTSVAPAALAQESSQLNPQQLEGLREMAAQARANAEAAEAARAAAAERTRQQLSTLTGRLDAAAAQNEILMQMMGQILATQAGASVEERIEAEIAAAEEQATELERATQDLVEGATTELERELAQRTQDLEDLLESVPDKEDLASWQKEQIEELNREIEEKKREVDEALDDYVERELLPAIERNCPQTTAYQRRSVVTSARSGENNADIAEALQGIGCSEAPELVRKLANARSAEEAQLAFQSSMQSMMMAAMMSGNPYLAAIAAALMLLSALFSDGNGDGDGDGVDDQPGGGPIPGAPAPAPPAPPGGTASTTEQPTTEPTDEPTTEPTNEPTTEPADETTTETADEPVGDPLDSRNDQEIRAAGGNPDVKAHPGVGCGYELYSGDVTLTLLNLADGDAFDIDITAIEGSSPIRDFPQSWTDPNIRLISCDFESESVTVQIEQETASLCLIFEPSQGEDGGYQVSDTGFSAGPNQLCEGG
ncbi:hypothetical protein ACNKFW_02005 [Paracoccus sp. TD-10]|uniref:hypothetical protein n=1 Tax=Paracoccus sp. TD-10 TaxID=3395918 RepID=UPI003AAC0A27